MKEDLQREDVADKHLLIVMRGGMSEELLWKDMGFLACYLHIAKGWDCTFGYFAEQDLRVERFEKYCRLLRFGCPETFPKEIKTVGKYLKQNAKNYDAIGFFNYGGFTNHISDYAKKYNPRIVTWCKFDMSDGGFSHFWDGTWTRKLKVLNEFWKMRNVDLFTTETKRYSDVLRKTRLFRHRVEYLPNGVSFHGIDLKRLDNIPKDGSIITIGRLGTHQKNTELFLSALEKMKDTLIRGGGEKSTALAG